MEFPIHGFLSDSQLVNASAEIAEAVNYPRIRLFTAGEPKQAQPGQPPMHDLQVVAQPWFVANSSTTAAVILHVFAGLAPGRGTGVSIA